ncbi:LysR family transcriptional regulator [Roseobacter sp.]|uniref:LysR family transcriptional regulator n=1 Tax=Roseobacter sp. TaxID=1907202 RepID=UPI003858D6AA
MSRNLPPLNALRAFDAAGRHGSFSGAAEELAVSHSAISRHVRGLESRLGLKLFRKLARGVELTQEGRAYLDRILPALDLIAEATDGLAATPRGRVTINSEPLFAERFIIPRLAGFQTAYPEIDVRLEASSLIADVERYEADIAIRYTHTGALGGPGDLLSAAPIYPYASPELAQGLRQPEDLLHVTQLRDRSKNIWRQWFAAVGVQAELPVDDGWRLRSRLAYEAGLNGLGVYMGSSECVSFDESLGRFVRCFDTGIRDGAFFLVHGSTGLRRTAVKQVRAWLLDETQAFRVLPAET